MRRVVKYRECVDHPYAVRECAGGRSARAREWQEVLTSSSSQTAAPCQAAMPTPCAECAERGSQAASSAAPTVSHQPPLHSRLRRRCQP